MKKIYLTFFTFTFLLLTLKAQPSITWQRYYTNPLTTTNYGFDICKADSNNFFVIGTINSAPPSIYIIKINSFGDTIWTKIIPEGGAYSGVSTGDGGCVITGSWFSYPTYAYIIKLDSNGNIIWQKFYGTPLVTCHKIIKCSDKGYIACGQVDYYSAFALKIDSLGNLQWQKIYQPIYYKVYKSVTEAYDGGYILMGGAVDSPTDTGRGLISKIDTIGNLLWEKRYLINSNGVRFDAIEKLNNGYIIGAAALDTNLNRAIISLMKIDYAGNVYSIKNYPANILRNYYVSDIKKLVNNRFVISYNSWTMNADTIQGSVYVTDTNGVVLKEAAFTGATETELLRILPLSNSDIIFVGNTNFLYENEENAYVVRVDSNLYAPPVGIKIITTTTPSGFKYLSNFPNPFNNSTVIKFLVPSIGTKKIIDVKIIIYDLTGKEVEVLINDEYTSGTYSYIWNPTNYSSGVYFCKIYFDNKEFTSNKMVLVK